MNIRHSRGLLLRAASPIAFAALLPVGASAQAVDPGLCEAIAGSSANANALSNVLRRADDPNAALLACAPTYDVTTLNAVIAAYEEAGDVNTVDQLRAVVADLTDTGSEELAATTQSVEEIVDPEGGEQAAPAGAAAGSTAEADTAAKTITVDGDGTATTESSVAAEAGEPKTITVDGEGNATASTGIDSVGTDSAAADGSAEGTVVAEAPVTETPPADTATDTTTDTVVVTEAPADAAPAADATDAETAALADALEAQSAADAEASGDAQVAQDGTAAATDGAADGTVTVEGSTAEMAQAEADAEATQMDAETTAQVDAAGGDVAAGIEAPQEDTQASAEAANSVPVASAAAAAAADAEAAPAAEGTATTDATASATAGSGEVTTTTVTAENAPSATEERSSSSDDDDTFKNALLLGLGAVAVGTLLANQGQVVEDTGDRVVVRRDSGDLVVLKNDDVLLRQPGSTIQTRTYDDGSTLTTVTREDGSRVVTVRAANGQVLRRTVINADGSETVLFDDTVEVAPVQVAELDATASASNRDYEVQTLQDALAADVNVDRRYSLQQIRQIRAVRFLAPELPLSDINFETASSVIRPEEAEELRDIGVAMRDAILANPGEVFLIEGHTDAVGSAAYNLALSDRRAESVALALTEFFGVPPENMVVQGYGESTLKVVTGGSERANRRASVRRITPLLRGEV